MHIAGEIRYELDETKHHGHGGYGRNDEFDNRIRHLY